MYSYMIIITMMMLMNQGDWLRSFCYNFSLVCIFYAMAFGYILSKTFVHFNLKTINEAASQSPVRSVEDILYSKLLEFSLLEKLKVIAPRRKNWINFWNNFDFITRVNFNHIKPSRACWNNNKVKKEQGSAEKVAMLLA